MSSATTIVITAGLVATAAGLLGPFLVLRRVALLSDAISHAVLPGIVVVFVVFGTRAPLPMMLGACVFALGCVLGVEVLRTSGLVKADAAIGLVFPALFALGVLGVQRYAADVHLDLDATIYGEIAFAPLRTLRLAGITVPRSVVVVGATALIDLVGVVWLFKELKVTSFDPPFAASTGARPVLVGRLLLGAVALTATSAFESVGAILVVTLLIVPAATAHLLTDRLVVMVALAVGLGWVSAAGGYLLATRLDASVAGAMGLVAGAGFALALVLAPRHGLLNQARRRAPRGSRAPVPLSPPTS